MKEQYKKWKNATSYVNKGYNEIIDIPYMYSKRLSKMVNSRSNRWYKDMKTYTSILKKVELYLMNDIQSEINREKLVGVAIVG